MRSESESIAFVNECRFALGQLFASLEERLTILSRTQVELEEQLESLQYRAEIENAVFIEQDQFSDAANYYHAKYLQKMQALENQIATITSEKTDLTTDVKQKELFNKTLAKLGATQTSLDILAAAVLQFGKQSLSFRHGRSRPTLSGARSIGSQSIVDVIWEGRNNALHWEDGTRFSRVEQMINKLNADFGLTLSATDNNSLKVIELLGWTDIDAVITDLTALVQA